VKTKIIISLALLCAIFGAFHGATGEPKGSDKESQPALRKLMGENKTEVITMKVPSASRLKKRPGRLEYQRGIMERDDDGQLVVRKTGAQGSGILSSMSQANCFIILPIESSTVEPGTMVDVQPFFGLV